jgi:hypothetical protein
VAEIRGKKSSLLKTLTMMAQEEKAADSPELADSIFDKQKEDEEEDEGSEMPETFPFEQTQSTQPISQEEQDNRQHPNHCLTTDKLHSTKSQQAVNQAGHHIVAGTVGWMNFLGNPYSLGYTVMAHE